MDRNVSIIILLLIAMISFVLSTCISSIEFNGFRNSKNNLNWEGVYTNTILSGKGHYMDVRIRLNQDLSFEYYYERMDGAFDPFYCKSSFQWDKNIATNDRHALSESNCYLSLDDLTLNFRGLKAHDPFHFYYNEKIELLLFTQLIFDLLIFEQQENKIKPNFRSGQPYDMAMDAFRCSKQKNDKFVYSLEITPSQLANIKSPVYDSFSDDDVIQDRFNSLHAALEIEKDGLKLLWAGIVR